MDIEKLVRENINKTMHMSLGTSKDNKPWVCEVHFAYDDNLNLYFRSKTSRRHSQEIAANPFVAGTIVRQHGLNEVPVGVYFEGTAQMLIEGEQQIKAAECIKARLGLSDEILEDAKNPDGHQFYMIIARNYYAFGKFGDNPTQKYELLCWNGGDKA